MKQKIIFVVCAAVIAFAGWKVWSSELVGQPAIQSGRRAMNVETRHKFYVQMDRNFSWPAKCPDTGSKTGYPVEVCYWNQCGKKEDGTWVILNQTLGKPGPTYCPNCNREVVPHNPVPPGFKHQDEQSG